MNIRMFASDVDGTILPRGGVISERTKAVIRKSMEMGVPFVISSGRWYVSAVDIANKLEIDNGYMIISGGGAVSDTKGNILKDWRLTREQAEEIYAIMQTEHVMITSFMPNAVYRMHTERSLRPVDTGLTSYLGGSYYMKNNDPGVFEAEALECPYKMEAYAGDLEGMERLRKRFIDMGYSVSSAYIDNLEVLAPGAGKGTALKWLAGRFGIAEDEVMAFGDNTNDIDMFSAAGWPVAVGNAVEALKEKARIIADNCEDDGVAKWMEKALEERTV